jgi:hypothetical protein
VAPASLGPAQKKPEIALAENVPLKSMNINCTATAEEVLDSTQSKP